MAHAIMPAETPEERELERKRVELARLTDRLAELESELTTLQIQLAAFEERYLQQVGRRYAELDAILADIAVIEAAEAPLSSELHARAEAAKERARASDEAVRGLSNQACRTVPDPALKALFRQVAKQIHPDLATDDVERLRREELMREANLAYAAGDRDRLQRVLHEWQTDPAAVTADGTAGELVRIIRRIAQTERRISELERRLEEVKSSDLFHLMMDTEKAKRQNRDLLSEMAREIDKQIAAARARLGRLRGACA